MSGNASYYDKLMGGIISNLKSAEVAYQNEVEQARNEAIVAGDKLKAARVKLARVQAMVDAAEANYNLAVKSAPEPKFD